MSERIIDEKLTLQIRKDIISGLMLREIQEKYTINDSTWDSWYYRNTQGFRDLVISAKKERMVKRAEDTSDEILSLQTKDDEGKPITDLLRIKQREAEFIRETLGKDHYSKRQEQTGKDGEALPTPILMNYVSSNDITKENKSDDQEDTNSTGGYISE